MPENKVFITRKVGNEAISLLEGKCTVKIWNSEEPIPKDELLVAVKGISGLFCTVSDVIDAKVLDAAGIFKKLSRVISLELLVVLGKLVGVIFLDYFCRTGVKSCGNNVVRNRQH